MTASDETRPAGQDPNDEDGDGPPLADPVANRITTRVKDSQALEKELVEAPTGTHGLPHFAADASWRYNIWYTEAHQLVEEYAPRRIP